MSDYVAEYLHYTLEDERRVGTAIPRCFGTDDYLVFNLSDLIDSELDGNAHAWGADKGKIDVSAKPKFEALRAEMVALIAKIDAIQYAGVAE